MDIVVVSCGASGRDRDVQILLLPLPLVVVMRGDRLRDGDQWW